MLTHKLSGVIFDLDNTLVSSNLNFNAIRGDIGCPNNIDLLQFVDDLPQKEKLNANKLLVEYEIYPTEIKTLGLNAENYH